MIEIVALAVATLHLSQVPAGPPAGCRIAVEDGHLVVRSQGREVRHELAGDELPASPGELGPPRVTALMHPRGEGLVFAALRERWDLGVAPLGLGRLYEIRCGAEPSLTVAMVAPGLDFGRVAVARDGRWVVGGWGGLRVLDPVRRRLTPLTSPPPYPAPRCWSAEEDQPARAADVPLVGDEGVAVSPPGAGDEEIAFIRGGPCGYEAEMETTRHALLIDRGVVRSKRHVGAFAIADDGQMLVGDGGGSCAESSGGALWRSADGERWQRLIVKDKGRAGIAALARIAGGPTVALTGICKAGGAVTGGELFVSDDLARWDPVSAVDEGGGRIGALFAEGERAFIAVEQDGATRWLASRDGRSWQASGPRRVPPVAGAAALARTLAVEAVLGVRDERGQSFAWTSDGLFEKDAAGRWARIFPRP